MSATPNDAARPVAQRYHIRGNRYGDYDESPDDDGDWVKATDYDALRKIAEHHREGRLNALEHLAVATTERDALRSEVERLRAQLREAREDRDTQEGTATQAFAAHARERARAETAEARASWLTDNLRSTLSLMKCDDEFIDKQINPPHLNAQGDEGNG